MDLRDIWRPDGSLLDVLIAVSQLNPGARVYQALGSDAAWSVEAHVTTSLLDAIREQTYVLIAQNAKNPKSVTPPEPTPRPAEARAKAIDAAVETRRQQEWEEMVARDMRRQRSVAREMRQRTRT